MQFAYISIDCDDFAFTYTNICWKLADILQQTSTTTTTTDIDFTLRVELSTRRTKCIYLFCMLFGIQNFPAP